MFELFQKFLFVSLYTKSISNIMIYNETKISYHSGDRELRASLGSGKKDLSLLASPQAMDPFF